MRPIQIVILLVALVAAGAAGMIAMNLGRAPRTAAPVASAPQIRLDEVLVASRDIGIGQPIAADLVTWRPWPADGVSEGFIVRQQRPEAVGEVAGSLAKAPILAGEPIRDAKLVRSDRGFLSAVLPKGMRAVAVKVNASTTAGGFILPNDRVDVLLVREAENGKRGEMQAETLMSNVRVLAIDQSIQTGPEEQKPVIVAQDTVTLELTPEQTELMAQAQELGTISLALRSIEDSATETSAVRRSSGVSVVRFGIPSQVKAADPR